MDFLELTNEYYANWLGVRKDVLKQTGVIFVETVERDKRQIGYSKPFNLFLFQTKELTVVSYSHTLKKQIEELSTVLMNPIAIEDLINSLEEIFKTPVDQEIKFYYEGTKKQINGFDVIELTKGHYEDYLKFFNAQHSKANGDGWLKAYFEYLCDHHLVFGIFENETLVCASDAPDMPYLADKIQEIGINTLADYRHKGYGQAVSLRWIESILAHKKCPIWSCPASNKSSESLAYKVGFKKIANVLKIESVRYNNRE